jgi:excisionase family DNA binding protein
MTNRPVLERGRMYRLDEVSAILGVDRTTVRRWIRQGLLPAKRIGQPYFVYGGDLAPETLRKPQTRLE